MEDVRSAPNPKDVVDRNRDDILRIAGRHGAYNVRVFGSVARGDATAGSDLDLLVDVGPRRTFFFPGGLIADLVDLLGINVDVVTTDALHTRIRDRILSEAVAL